MPFAPTLHSASFIIYNESMNQQPLSQPVESPIDPSPYSNQPKPTPKLPLLIILPILIATIAGGIGFFISKQAATPKSPSAPLVTSTPVPNDPTANWKTYTNTLAGYILKYPDEWTPMTKSAGLGLDNAKDDAQEVSISLLSIKVFDYPLPKYEYLNWNKEKVNLNGIESTKYQKYDSADKVLKEFYLFYNPRTQKYIQYYTQDPNQQNRKKYDQILETFRFTN